eukprot:gene396-6810_t
MFIFNWIFNFLNELFQFSTPSTVLFLGLENSGKTTLFKVLKSGKIGSFLPTQFPNQDELSVGNTNLKAIDLGGHELVRKLWEDYISEDVSGIVYIIDAADKKKFNDSKRELHKLLKNEQTKDIPFLILGNKIDRSGAVSEDELKDIFEIETTGKTVLSKKEKGYSQRPIDIFMCSIIEEVGYGPGIIWLCDNIKNKNL